MSSKQADGLLDNTVRKEEKLPEGNELTVGSEKPVPWLMTCRVTLAILSCFGFTIMYSTKVNLSVAIVCMVNHSALPALESSLNRLNYTTEPEFTNLSFIGNMTSNFTDEKVDDTSSKCISNVIDGKTEDGEFVWDKYIQNLVLGSFFYGYITTQIPGGWLAGKFGGKRIFGWFMFLCVAATLLTPVAARVHYGFLMAMRILVGLGQGVVWPAMHAIWAYWAPPQERSKLIGFTFSGTQVGNVVAFPLSGLLCKYGFDGGWPSIFYVLGIMGFVWFLLWMFLVSDTPGVHPRITEQEKVYIQTSLKGAMKKGIEHDNSIPWHDLLTSLPVWATVVTHTCANWVTYTFLTNMPNYMKEVLKFDITSNGLLSALPYIGMWVSTVISGIIADALIKSKKLTVTNTRKLFNTLGEVVPAAMIISLGFLDCSLSVVAVILLTVAIAFTGCPFSAGYMVNPADIAPKYSSIIFGISNTAATIPGILAPFTVGQLTPNKSQEEWRKVFYIAAAIATFGNIFYLIFGSGDLQEWAKEKEDVSSEEKVELKKMPGDEETMT